jgi:hypothetical protein
MSSHPCSCRHFLRSARVVGLAALAAAGWNAFCLATDPLSLGRVGQASAQASSESVPATALEADQRGLAAPAEFTGRDGVLALVDGRVVAGRVTAAPGGYLLKRHGAADEMVPSFLVQTAADSLTGCYENLRDQVRNPRPDDHLRLADWCLRQKLYEEARTEVTAALKLDANRRDARELLVRLEELTNPTPRNRQAESSPVRTRDGYLAHTAAAGGEPGPETTSLFVRRIQPLLVSKCGNAGCHGGSDAGEFQLSNIRRNSSSGRVTTLENLKEVMSFVDSGSPQATGLLKALQSPTHEDVFSGTAAAGQRAALREWVAAAARDKGFAEDPFSIGQPPVGARQPVELASGEVAKPSQATRAVEKPALRKVGAAPVLRPTPDADAVADRILKEERPDPFDPDEFNRKVHAVERSARPDTRP